jgi:hypothetical protein
MTTLCPSFFNFTAVSTIRDRVDRRGSWLFSSTIELVPMFHSINTNAIHFGRAQSDSPSFMTIVMDLGPFILAIYDCHEF